MKISPLPASVFALAAISLIHAAAAQQTKILLAIAVLTIVAQDSRAAVGYEAAVRADGPIAYWRFNDTPPTAVNTGSLGAAANGTYNGGATAGAQAPRPPAFVGFDSGNTALQCDGVAAFVGTLSGLMNSRPFFTISGWMRRNADQPDRTGLWGQNDLVEFGYINNNTLQVWTDNGLDISPNPIPNGEWAHLAIVSTGSGGANTITMYTNGVVARSRPHTLSADNIFPFNIGGGGVFDDRAANGNYFNGQIDEVAIFDKALNAAQIAAQYHGAFVPVDQRFNFNDCTLPPGTSFPGAGNVGRIADDGTGSNCVVHLTDAAQSGAFGVFSIVPQPGPVDVDHIHLHWRSLVGGDTNAVCTGGADGYSMSWGTDLPNPPSYGNPGEEGAGSGLIVTVDTFDNGNGEAPGLEIKWRGARVAFDRINPDPGLAKDFLRKGVFVEADLTVDTDGQATFIYDGRVLTTTLINWSGIPGGGGIMFGARTGGACDNHWIDDLLIERVRPSLPIYQVIHYGAVPSQVTSLAESLHLNTNMLSFANGEVSFLDPAKFMAAPTVPITNPVVISNLLAETENPYPSIPIRFESLDFTAMSNMTVLSSNVALVSAANAFANANLIPELGTPVIYHTTLNTVYTNDSNLVVSNSAHLDTQVHYQFNVPGGYPLIGPGAQVQLAYGPTGNVTRLLYAAPKLTPGQSVQIISPNEASNRVARLLDPNSLLKPKITVKLVYFVPRWPWPPCLSCPPPDVTNTVLPWYQGDGTATVTNQITGEVSTLELLSVLTPAIDDPQFVPVANLSASAPGGTQVVASVMVTGGTPPYSYLWGGSSPDVSTNTGGHAAYTPVVVIPQPSLEIDYVAPRTIRVSWSDPSPGFMLESTPTLTPPDWTPVSNPVTTSNGLKSVTTIINSAQTVFFRLRSDNQAVSATETVTVTVTDANGVEIHASQTVPVQIVPTQRASASRTSQQSPRTARAAGVIDWGTESPYEPGDGTQDRIDWRSGMLAGPDGGVERFLWTGKLAWDLDFIEQPVGENDRAVDDADIVLYIGHGEPLAIGFTGRLGSSSDYLLHYNEAPHAWGNKDQEWMCFLSCSVLLFDHPIGNAWQRWGPNFDGLHVLTGFRTNARIGSGFPKAFANDMLIPRHPFFPIHVPIVAAWFEAALAIGTGVPAAIGPIGPDGVLDLYDTYWGKGPVGPTIRASQIRGWWYCSYYPPDIR